MALHGQRFGLPLTTQLPQQGFQLGGGGQQTAPLPVPAGGDLAGLLSGGGGAGEILSLISMLQSMQQQTPQAVPQAQEPLLNLTGPVDGQKPPPRSRTAQTPRATALSTPSSGFTRSNTPAPFQGGITGNTTQRAQEIARLVGGTVGSQGIKNEGQFISPTQQNRVDTTIIINGKPFSFTQLEIALLNRGTNGLANTLALEGGITNEFTNANATAGPHGKF